MVKTPLCRILLVVTALLCVFMLFTYAFGAGFDTEHECGEHFCSVCFGVSLCRHIAEIFPAAVFVLFTADLSRFSVKAFVGFYNKHYSVQIPVCLKVKLSN